MSKLALVIGQHRAAVGRKCLTDTCLLVPLSLRFLCYLKMATLIDLHSKCKFSKISPIYVISKICSEECVSGTKFFQYFTVRCHCICRKLTIWLPKYVMLNRLTFARLLLYPSTPASASRQVWKFPIPGNAEFP